MALSERQSSRIVVSSSNKRRNPGRRRTVHDLVSTSTTAAVIFSSIVLLSRAHPSVHALITPSTMPQNRPLRHKTPSSPIDRTSRTFSIPTKSGPWTDHTVLGYIDERISVDEWIESTILPPVPTPNRPLRRFFRACCELKAQVKTIKKRDRQLYFEFVESQQLLDANDVKTESILQTRKNDGNYYHEKR